jgi:DNA replication licensing factor MCM4
MVLVHNRSAFANRQVIRLQETPDVVPDGQTPHTVSLCVYDELVDLVKPGDRITVTGIFRAIPVRVNARQRTIKSVFKTHVDTLHIQLTGDGRLGFDKSTRSGERAPGVGTGGTTDETFDDDEFPLADDELAEFATQAGNAELSAKAALEKKLKELSKREDIYEYLARSLAPSIWGMDDVKKGVLLQLFGGTNKSISKGGGGAGTRYRGDINVLLVGDPGTSKSQILSVSFLPSSLVKSAEGDIVCSSCCSAWCLYER